MKITPVAERFGGGSAKPSPPRGFGGQERRLPVGTWHYITLVCGHSTTPEEIEANRLWAPRGKCFCDDCGKWVGRKPKPKPKPLPDTPMF